MNLSGVVRDSSGLGMDIALQGELDALAGATVPLGSVGLLSSKSYGPASPATYSTTSAASADVDATNLILPDFVVPPSGQVLVVLSAAVFCGAATTQGSWSLRDGSGDIAGSNCAISQDVNTVRVTYRRLFTGLTPGATITGWKWAHCRSAGASTAYIFADDGTVSSADTGPALMEVWAA